MIKKLILIQIVLITGSFLTGFAQPSIQWQYSYGGTQPDGFETGNGGRESMIPTADGGFVIAVSSNSDDIDVSGHHGSTAMSDIWIFKIDSLGGIVWEKSLGGTGDERRPTIKSTSDGGYILSSSTNSTDGDVTGFHDSLGTTNSDTWIVKLDSVGTIEWEHAFGGSDFEDDASVCETADGGFLFICDTRSNDEDVSGSHGDTDILMMKLDHSGNVLWQKCIGGSSNDQAYTLRNTADSGFVFMGRTNSTDGDAVGNMHTSIFGANWVVKIDSLGNIEWQRAYGGSVIEFPGDIYQTSDGGYIFGTSTGSNDGDVTGNHGFEDYWIVRLDATGNILWQKCFGGTNADSFKALYPTSDNGVIASGFSSCTDGDLTNNYGADDVWVIKLDSAGNLEWQRSFGGTMNDNGGTVLQTSDGGFIVCAESFSNDFDVSGHHGPSTQADVWIFKLSPFTTGIEELASVSGLSVSPNPASDQLKMSFYLSKVDDVSVEIMDIAGRIVKTWEMNRFVAGSHELTWDINSDSRPEEGLYFVRLTTPSQTISKSILLSE